MRFPNEGTTKLELQKYNPNRIVIVDAHGWTQTLSDGKRRVGNPTYGDVIRRFDYPNTLIVFCNCNEK